MYVVKTVGSVFSWSSVEKDDCIALSDNNYELLVEKGDCLNEGFECAFECDGILGCYKLSRCIYLIDSMKSSYFYCFY